MASAPNIIRFVAFDPQSVGPGAGRVAHLLGPDDMPMAGEVRISAAASGGVQIKCSFFDEEIAAVALPARAGRSGTLMLQTCLLTPRQAPYGLLVELARHRIKQFIQKCEEWQMWDPGLARGAMRLWDDARSVFAKALLESDPLASERLARRSLERSVEASEHLAMAHAEILLHRRYGTRPAGSVVLGTVLRASTPSKPVIEDTLAREMDVLHVPLSWREIEPVRGKPDFAALDRWMQWAAGRRKPIMAGPLVDLREEALPDHVRVFRHDYEAFRDLAYDHVERMVARYGGAVGIWNVGRGFHANEFLELSADEMVDLARRTILVVRQRHRKANTLIELVDPFGQAVTRRRGALLPWRYIELLQQEGIPFSAAGLRLVLGRGEDIARDLFQVSGMLDRFLGRETRLLLSAFGVPSEEVDPDAGTCRDGWSPEAQASWAGRVTSVALSKPFVETLFWAETSDAGAADALGYGLFDREGQPRPVLAKLVGIRKRLRGPLGPRPDARGEPTGGSDGRAVRSESQRGAGEGVAREGGE